MPSDSDSRTAAHAGEGVVAAAALQHAETQQDPDRADVRDQEIQEAGTANLRDAMVGRHQEVRRKRHRLPCDHEHVRVVGDEHQRHRGEEGVVLQAEQSRCGTLACAEVARGEDRDAAAGRAEEKQEERRQRVQPDMEGQVGQAERQDERLGRVANRDQGDCGKHEPHCSAGGEKYSPDEHQVARSHQAQHADRDPGEDRGDDQGRALITICRSSPRRRPGPNS